MVMRKCSSSSTPASSANLSAAASISLTLSIVEGSEKLRLPGLESIKGFVSASTGNGKAPPYRERKGVVFHGRRENAIDGSFIAKGRYVKKWFELGEVWGSEMFKVNRVWR